MREYRIWNVHRANEEYRTMVITYSATGEYVAEYRLTSGCEQAEIAGRRRFLNKHLAKPNATLGNFQW